MGLLPEAALPELELWAQPEVEELPSPRAESLPRQAAQPVFLPQAALPRPQAAWPRVA